jgi:uncharacterized membrane protein
VARATLALSSLAIAGASVALCLAFLGLPDSTSFLLSNQAPAPQRNLMLVAMLLGGLAPSLAALLVLLLRGQRGLDSVDRAGRLAAPLTLTALLPVLFDYRTWSAAPLTFLILLAIVALLAERLFDRSFRAIPAYLREGAAQVGLAPALRRHLPTLVVVTAALSYALYFSHYTLLQHRRFGTYGFDLGINVNWCFNALEGHPFRSTVLFGPDGGNFISGHAIFAMFLWLPIFALKPGAEVLLVYQSVMVGLAAIPLYLFARTQIPRWTAVIVALVYLSYAPLHGPNFYDYHELLVALPFHFLLYWLIATGRLGWATLLVPIIWAHREDMAVGLVILGSFLALAGYRVRFGIGLAVSSLVWFMIIKFAIMPAAGSWWFADIYKQLMPEGTKGYGGVVQTILINPAFFLSTLLRQDKLIYFLHMFAPLAFLPCRRFLLIYLAIPGFFFTLMTTGYAPTLGIGFQYTTHWVPYVFASTVIGLRLLGQQLGAERRQAAACAALLAVWAHSAVFGAVFQHDTFVGGSVRVTFEESEKDKRTYAAFTELIANIPPDASVAASETEVPHIAARLNAYTLRSAHGDATYLLVRKNGSHSVDVLRDAFTRNDYGLVGQHDRTFYLFKKDHKSDQTKRAMAELGIRLPPKVPSESAAK